MPSRVRDFFTCKADGSGGPLTSLPSGVEPPPSEIVVDNVPAFALARHMTVHEGYPITDWEAVQAWVSDIGPSELQGQAWGAVERGWLLHCGKHLDRTSG